jgi:hypothetical protein
VKKKLKNEGVMKNTKANSISTETKNEAFKVAKATQKPGQTKDQTKLITQGIEKGIAEYKKQNKVNSRIRDKQRKQLAKDKKPEVRIDELPIEDSNSSKLSWSLLALSWIFFAVYLMI